MKLGNNYQESWEISENAEGVCPNCKETIRLEEIKMTPISAKVAQPSFLQHLLVRSLASIKLVHQCPKCNVILGISEK